MYLFGCDESNTGIFDTILVTLNTDHLLIILNLALYIQPVTFQTYRAKIKTRIINLFCER